MSSSEAGSSLRRKSPFRAIAQEIRHRGIRPGDRVGFALSGLRPGGRDAWLDRRLNVEPRYGWLFILGVTNSGTTILKRLLRNHPEVRVMPKEGRFLTRAFPRPVDRSVRRVWALESEPGRWTEDDPGEPAVQAKFDWARFYPKGSGYLLEKSPPNTLRARWLQRYFPPSRFIAMLRHPYAACEGMNRRGNCGLEAAARQWATVNGALAADMSHLDRFLLVKYEALTGDPLRMLETMESFLALKSPLDRSVVTSIEAHSIQGRTTGLTNLNHLSVARLTEDELDMIDSIAGPVMEHFGYNRSNASAPPVD